MATFSLYMITRKPYAVNNETTNNRNLKSLFLLSAFKDYTSNQLKCRCVLKSATNKFTKFFFISPLNQCQTRNFSQIIVQRSRTEQTLTPISRAPKICSTTKTKPLAGATFGAVNVKTRGKKRTWNHIPSVPLQWRRWDQTEDRSREVRPVACARRRRQSIRAAPPVRRIWRAACSPWGSSSPFLRRREWKGKYGCQRSDLSRCCSGGWKFGSVFCSLHTT